MHQCDYCCWYNPASGCCNCPYVMRRKACEKARKQKEENEKPRKLCIFTKPKLSNPVSWEDMKEFNTHMKEVVRDYKIRQAKARESAKKVIIK